MQLLNPTGQLRSITVAEGTTDQATQWFGYDAAGNQTVMVDENGHLTEYHYDLKTNRLLEVVAADPDGAGPLTTPKTVYTYDDNGNQITVTDPDGHVTTSHYDALNRLDKVTGADPDGTSGPLLAPITTYIYDHNGNLTMTTDPLGHTTQSSYDARNRLSGMTNPDGSTTQTLYDFDNNATGSINARSQRTNTIYDARGRRLRETDALGNTTRYVYDPANQLIATIDAKGNLTRYVYDDLGRQLEVIDAQGHHTKTEYDKNGNVTATIDALGHRTEYRYDARDRRIQVIDATNTVLPLTQQKATVTTYDKVGNVLTIKDPDLNTTTYTYDGLNRLVADTNQLGQTRTYGYDAAGNQTSVTDRNGHTRTLTYDGLNRQTQENWLNGSGSGIRAITSIYNVGSQLTELQDPDSDYHYTYDLNGRVQTITNAGTPGVVPVVLTYAYDGNGNLTSVVDTINGQAGGTTSYTFDPLDQVSQINQTGVGVQSKQVNLGYNALGQMATINRYADLNGTQLVAGTTYTYDALNRLQQLSHKKADGSNLASYTYGYDKVSRINQIISSADGTTTYNYDDTNQLTGADKPGTTADEGYTYDANGNRTNTGYQTGGNNQLSSDGTYNYTYDNEGNLKTRTEIATGKVRAFTWDYRHRLTGVTDKTGGTVTQQVSYTYDALNQRIAKTVGAQTTRFVYDRGNVYLEFSGTSTTSSTRYLYGPMVDQVLAQESNGQTTWMLADHLGSVRDLVNNSGTVVNHFTYDSFGQVVGSMAGATADTRYKFTGREFDQETGLYYYRARYFDAGVGRFMGQDPMGFGAGDRNLYRYVGNSPLNATDPSGLQAVFGIDPPIINPFPPVPGSLLLPPKITPEQERTLENYKRADRRRLKSEPNECISAPINGRLPTSTPTNATLKNANGYADYVTGQTDDFLVIRPDGLGKAFDGVNTGNRTLLEAKYGYWRVPLSNEALKNDPRSIETRDKQRASVLRSLSVEEQVAAYCGYNLNAYFQNPNAYNWFKANYSSPDLIVSPFGGFKYQFNMVNKPWQPPRSK